jgi:hypothetical protein
MRKINILILLLLFTLLPQTLLANAGTALMWVPIMQLIFGNILIGIVEGIIISVIFRTKWIRSILIMIAGNYVSWLIGNGLIYVFQNTLIDSLFKLDNVFALWILSLIILYLLTVLIELPFFRWAFTKNDRLWSRSWKLSLIINAVTYTIMIFIYLSASKYSFFADLKIDQSILNNKIKFELFYTFKGDIYKGLIKQDIYGDKIYQIPNTIKYPYLKLKEDSINQSIDLYLVNYYGDTLLFQKSFVESDNKIYYPSIFEKYNWTKADFRDTTNRDWKASAGGWAIEGITFRDNDTTIQNYGFEVPWMFWGIGNVSILNDSEVICIINDRIIILNKDTKKVAFVTKGNDYMIRKNN